MLKSKWKVLMFISLLTNSYIAYLCDGEIQTPEKSLIFYLLMTPFILYFFEKFVIGEKIDITDEVELKILNKSNSKVDSLQQLKKSNLINEEEFNLKLRGIYKDQLIEEGINTDELKNIKKALSEKLITEEEFRNMYNKIIEREVDNRINKKL